MAVGIGASLDNNEFLWVMDEVALLACGPSIETNYKVRWGCNSIQCNADEQEANFSSYITVPYGQPIMTYSSEILNKALDLCGDPNMQVMVRFNNIAEDTGVPGVNSMYNVNHLIANYELGREIIKYEIIGRDGTALDLTSYLVSNNPGGATSYEK